MRRLGAPIVVAAVALGVRIATAAGITFPVPEDSAYYVDAARNLAVGRGLVSDVVWSYATPPLVVPRAAFDLWQPLASFLAAPFTAVLGPSLAAAQVPAVLFGAAVAPLAWLIARRAAHQIGLPRGRADVVAFTGGILVALTPLLVVQSAEPDSSAPYTALAVAACALVPSSLDEGRRATWARVLLGMALGLAYLARSDAVFVLAAYLLVAVVTTRAGRWDRGEPRAGATVDRRPAAERHGATRAAVAVDRRLARTVPALGLAALVSAPWLLRQAVTWDASPFGQLIENAWSLRPSDIFAWATRPDLAGYLQAGPARLLALRVDAAVGDALLLLIGAFPAVPLGVLTLAARPRLVTTPILRALGIVAVLTFTIDVLVFPVAGRSGLWAHGAGPVMVLLAVVAAFGLEGLIARVGTVRSWEPARGPTSRAGLIAPLAVAVISIPLLVVAATLEHERSTTAAAQYAALATVSGRWDLGADEPIVSDHPMWVSEALAHPSLALPREPPASIVDLMRHFRAAALVVREDDPEVAFTALALAAYRDAGGRACFPELPTVAPFRAFGFACATETAAIVPEEPAVNVPTAAAAIAPRSDRPREP